MSWLPSLGWGSLIALAIPPLAILLFYFLKIRRPAVQVPSTLLWTRTIEDFNANSPWQRFRHQILLYLQLLAVGLIILAALRPGCRGTDLGGDRFVLLIDNSASMSATDVKPTRLDRAKQEAERIVDNMKPRDVAMVISFSDIAAVEQSYTANKSRLKGVVRSIQQADRYTDLTEALKLATGLSNVGQTSDRESKIDIQVAESLDATAFVLSDGCFAKLPDVLLGKLRLDYRPIGEALAFRNVGIVACQLTSSPELNGPIQLFVRLENFSTTTEVIDVAVEINGQLCDAKQGVSLATEKSTSIILDLVPFIDPTKLPAIVRVSISPDDDLMKDNEAQLLLAPVDKVKMVVVSALPSILSKVLTTAKVLEAADVEFHEPSWLDSPEYQQQVAARQFDAIIYDQCSPKELPNCNTIFFDRVPPMSEWSATELQFPAPIVFSSRYHPLVSNLALADVLFLEARKITGPVGSVSLIESTFGPMIAIGPRGEFEDLVIGFPLQKLATDGTTEMVTNWPTRPSFPTFFYNVLAYQLRHGPQRSNDPIPPGQPISLATSSVVTSELVIERPDGSRVSTPVGNSGQVSFEDTDKLGVYQEVEGSTKLPSFVVNLARSDESNIRPRDSIDVSYQSIVGKAVDREVQRELWPWLVALTLIVLVIEWFVYIRRLIA